MPIRLKIILNNINNINNVLMSCIVLYIVCINKRKLPQFLTNLNILNNLIVLKVESDPLFILSDVKNISIIIISNIDNITMVKSNIFYLSSKYFFTPKPNILIIISNINIYVHI